MEYNGFTKDFVFGSASAAFQIEGAVSADGKGPSIWDKFSNTKGKIRNNDTAEKACDHYHKIEKDVALMKSIGLSAYRFSISWPRIMPDGEGLVNEKGISFYNKLIDELIKNDITPWVTLFHWDLPLALQKKYKGFQNRKVVDLFGEFTRIAVERFGDRVKNWITINEPFEFSCFGHLLGTHAPGLKSPRAYFHVMHNVLLAHGKALRIIKKLSPEAKVGIVISMTPIHPATDTPKDKSAAKIANEFMNDITLMPLYKGRYPEELWKRAVLFRPKIKKGDMDIITSPADFIGLNYYSREKASFKWYIPILKADISGSSTPEKQFIDAEGKQRTSMGWEIYPEGLRECLHHIKETGNNPDIYITETGGAFDDELSPDGTIKDELRTSLLQKYFKAASTAIEEGVNLKGIFLWSLMDNYEWAEGLSKRFGLIYVDYKTQKRTIKDSGYWYKKLIGEICGR
ncbi:MAG: beta-glucosidase [Spirochaetales bacterium]|nr:beta-glucosidase [Spirochaetales bacterium]